MLCSGLFEQLQRQYRHLEKAVSSWLRNWHKDQVVELTFWASLVDGDNRLLIRGVDGLKGLPLLALHELSIDVQAEGLLVGDAGGLDFLCQRHVCA